MGVEVCTVWAPRNKSDFDYLNLLNCQRKSCKRFKARHRVMTDTDLPGFNTTKVKLPESLMKAMIAGVIERLKMGGGDHIVFVDVDCLVARELDEVFEGPQFDLGITNRENEISPINNGVMYVNVNGMAKALAFFERALELCGDHWGGDQEAISQAAAPVPAEHTIENRNGFRLAFLSMRQYNNAPKKPYSPPYVKPYVFHFKGASKVDMPMYQRVFFLE